jgi:hypothetical protein
VDMSDCCLQKCKPILCESDASYTFITQLFSFSVKYLDGVAVVWNAVTLDVALPSGSIRRETYTAFLSSIKPHDARKLMTQ